MDQEALQNFKKDLSIGDKDLESMIAETFDELIPKYVEEYIRRLGDYERQKVDLKIEEARLSIDVRENPMAYGLTKTTEKALEEAVDANPKLEKLRSKLVSAKTDVAAYNLFITFLKERTKTLSIFYSTSMLEEDEEGDE